jgi:UDP-N-acetylmuramate dehydrogenase
MDIQENISLKEYNTLQVDVKARFFVKVKNEQEILDLMWSEIRKNNTRFILWWWANTLFTWDFDGLVIKNEIVWKEIIYQKEREVFLKVGAWEARPEFVYWCVEKNLWGVENLVEIPGSVWAAPIGNIWAYGVEVKDIIEEVEFIHLDTWKKEIFKNRECKFWYRDSIFKNTYKDKIIVTYVIFKLKKVDETYHFTIDYKDIKNKIEDSHTIIDILNLRNIADIIADIRSSKLPDWKRIGTAGSFFKNPVVSKKDYKKLKFLYPALLGFDFEDKIKLSAGQLIEMSGFKWINKGKVGTYSHHALVVVNQGWSGEDIAEFARIIQDKVRKQFTVQLELEVCCV